MSVAFQMFNLHASEQLQSESHSNVQQQQSRGTRLYPCPRPELAFY